VSLARDYNRTVVLTIHQPRSNIVSLFDQLVLLAKGQVIYSGELAKCQGYLEKYWIPLPSGLQYRRLFE
jgi:ABC-type multidrug transport system ATPase subunit